MKLLTWTASSLMLLATASSVTQGMFRFGCFNNLVVDRIDPIVSPGNASGHVRAISGGNGFSKNADGTDLKASICTSCPIGADLSAYWVPRLYVKFKNDTGYGLVENHQIVYYKPHPTGDEKATEFPAAPPRALLVCSCHIVVEAAHQLFPSQLNFRNLRVDISRHCSCCRCCQHRGTWVRQACRAPSSTSKSVC